MTDTNMAVDPGQFNSVLCWNETTTRSTAFRTARSTPASAPPPSPPERDILCEDEPAA